MSYIIYHISCSWIASLIVFMPHEIILKRKKHQRNLQILEDFSARGVPPRSWCFANQWSSPTSRSWGRAWCPHPTHRHLDISTCEIRNIRNRLVEVGGFPGFSWKKIGNKQGKTGWSQQSSVLLVSCLGAVGSSRIPTGNHGWNCWNPHWPVLNHLKIMSTLD